MLDKRMINNFAVIVQHRFSTIVLETLNVRMFLWVENSIVTKLKVCENVIGFITCFRRRCEIFAFFTEDFETDSALQ